MKAFTIIISLLLLSFCENLCDLDTSEGATPEECKGLAIHEEFTSKGLTRCCYFEGKEKSADTKIVGCIPVTEEHYKDQKLLEEYLKSEFEEVDKTICGSYSYYLNIWFLSLLFIIL